MPLDDTRCYECATACHHVEQQCDKVESIDGNAKWGVVLLERVCVYLGLHSCQESCLKEVSRFRWCCYIAILKHEPLQLTHSDYLALI